jgi:hypothetical protein
MSKKIYCFKCGEEHEPDDFTPFERNPALADRDGKVIWCRKKCNEYVNERGNTLASLKEILRIVDIPFVESVYKTARKMFTKKVKGTNIVTRKNVYSGEEETTKETIMMQSTIYSCYTSKISIMSPKNYVNYGYSDGLRTPEMGRQNLPVEEKVVVDKEIKKAETKIKNKFGEDMFNNKEKLAKAVSLYVDGLNLKLNHGKVRQEKFQLKSAILKLIEYGVLKKDDYKWIDETVNNNEKSDVQNETNKSSNSDEEFVLPKGYDKEELIEKWGFGYTAEELYRFERKFQMLKNNYPEKTALHTEALVTYVRYRVKEEIATSRGDVKEAKEWGALASKASQDGKLNISQLSKSDLSDGLDTFGQLVRAVEQAVDIIPILPRFKKKPQDSVDFTIWCYINYIRDMKGLPPAEYEDIYQFYEERKKSYAQSRDILDNEVDDNA